MIKIINTIKNFISIFFYDLVVPRITLSLGSMTVFLFTLRDVARSRPDDTDFLLTTSFDVNVYKVYTGGGNLKIF